MEESSVISEKWHRFIKLTARYIKDVYEGTEERLPFLKQGKSERRYI